MPTNIQEIVLRKITKLNETPQYEILYLEICNKYELVV